MTPDSEVVLEESVDALSDIDRQKVFKKVERLEDQANLVGRLKALPEIDRDKTMTFLKTRLHQAERVDDE